jgi:hypothetical protein
MAKLSDHDLKQIDAEWLSKQPEAVIRRLLDRALEDLKAARDRLNQGPDNSSRPSGSMPPWQRAAAITEEGAASQDGSSQETTPGEEQPKAAQPGDGPGADAGKSDSKASGGRNKRAGRRFGAPGHGRGQKLEPTRREEHRPSHCAACGQALGEHEPAQAWTGWDMLELVPLGTREQDVLGVRIEVTRHQLMKQRCACGHTSRAQAVQASADALWPGVQIGQQRLLGPKLAAAIVHLCVRMRLPRRKVRELLLEWFGLELSTALIDQTVHQAARSVAPLETQLIEQLEQASLVHADETSWSEAGKALWLWVVCSSHTVLYMIGARTKEMFDNALSPAFTGLLMSDGYVAYRERLLRLRCWAHLLRKLRGVAESTDGCGARAGAQMLRVFETLMEAVYAARQEHTPPQSPAGRPAAPPAVTHAKEVEQLRRLCQRHRDAGHQALREVAREFLNDWQAIMRVLGEPGLPLTNNLAERMLRHYVIARRISYGTRTWVGSQSMGLLASIFDTCHLRGARATDLLAQAIHAARCGLPAPALPDIPPTGASPRITLSA